MPEREMIDARFAGSIGAFALDVAFRMPLSGVTALFGPSGCGKTTLLRCLAGLEHLPGRLTVGEAVWQDSAASVFVPPHRRAVGYVFQEASLFLHLSVRKNLLFGARRAGWKEGQGGDFEEIIDLLGIAPLLDRAPAALSGGERQRVAIGRALLSRPKILLMDEPLAALDRMSKDDILPYLEAISNARSLPIVYVSHDISEVARLADRIVVLARGTKVTDGPVASILERLDLHPATGRFEAGVVLTARIVKHDEQFQLTHLNHAGQTIVMPMTDGAVGDAIRLRIRARDVSLAVERPTGISIRNILTGTVSAIVEEPDTAFAETLVDIGGAGIRSRVTRASVADLGLEPGRDVYVLVKSITFERRNLVGRRRDDGA